MPLRSYGWPGFHPDFQLRSKILRTASECNPFSGLKRISRRIMQKHRSAQVRAKVLVVPQGRAVLVTQSVK
jgi:hypothetical protein